VLAIVAVVACAVVFLLGIVQGDDLGETTVICTDRTATALTSAQWALAAATALSVLIAEEARRAVVRAMGGTERT